MVDIRGEWDNSQKSCLIGDIVTSLVDVAEKVARDFFRLT
jgi:hypothetical protein